MIRARVAALVIAGALLAGCTAGDDGTATDDTTAADEATAPSVPTGPAPGVTADSVKVGIQYVDLASLGDIVSLDHGDYEAAYEAVIDEINGAGGIHGRTIEAVFAPINPIGTEPADAACVQLAEDAQVFLVMGFFLNDAVLCPLEAHQTAVIGGSMTAERLERAEAPWFTSDIGSDMQVEVVEAFAEGGIFDGTTLGVYNGPGGDPVQMEVMLTVLDELGVDVVESGTADAPPDDVAAANAATAVVAERFQTSGVDQVLTVGLSGLAWASGTEPLDYRPQVLFTDPNSILAYTMDAAGRDLSVLDEAVAGNIYGGSQNTYELPAMQECLGVIEEAGIEVPAPETREPQDPELHVAPFAACTYVTLLAALLEAAGEDLNYGSLVAGADGLEVQLPNQPDPVTYGPPPAADGDPTPYLFDWDPDEQAFVLRDG